jgi:hypothetical protein
MNWRFSHFDLVGAATSAHRVQSPSDMYAKQTGVHFAGWASAADGFRRKCEKAFAVTIHRISHAPARCALSPADIGTLEPGQCIGTRSAKNTLAALGM